MLQIYLKNIKLKTIFKYVSKIRVLTFYHKKLHKSILKYNYNYYYTAEFFRHTEKNKIHFLLKSRQSNLFSVVTNTVLQSQLPVTPNILSHLDISLSADKNKNTFCCQSNKVIQALHKCEIFRCVSDVNSTEVEFLQS